MATYPDRVRGDDGDGERQREVREVLLKALGVVVAIAVVIWLGSWAMVKTLGLDDVEANTKRPVKIEPAKPLPTTALPVPSNSPGDKETEDPTDDPSASDDPASGKPVLSASPLKVTPMGRINLTGQWPGHDSVSLAVQRFEDGRWADFGGVRVRVRAGAFTTYVMTGRTGDQRFRVFDPASKTASKAVTVTVG